MSIETVEVPCPGCYGTSFEAGFEARGEEPAPVGPWSYVLCLGCRSQYLRHRPRDLAALYGVGYHVHGGGGLKTLVERLMARIEARRLRRWAGRGRKAFEIGCGRGLLLAELVRGGAQVAGVEPSPAAAAHASSQGLDVACGGLADSRGGTAQHQLVIATHVFEHLERPADLLLEMHRLLAPNGVAFVKTPVTPSWADALFGGSAGVVRCSLSPVRAEPRAAGCDDLPGRAGDDSDTGGPGSE